MGHEHPTRQIADLSKSIDMSSLASKSVLITGGASGLGAQMAVTFAQHNAHVTIADINEELGLKFVEQQAAQGIKMNFVRTDVTSWESQVSAFKSAIKFGNGDSIDIVCAAAGLGGARFIVPDEESVSLEKDPPKPPMVDAIYNVNAKGVFFTSKLAQLYFGLKSQVRQPYKKVLIVFSSLAGYLELNAADYCSTKWAVRGIFRSIRSVMEDLGYRTNLIAPWVMDTPMAHDFAEICRANDIPVGKVSNVIDVVVRCAVDESISGRALAISSDKSFDLEDDLAGLNAGGTMKAYHNTAEVDRLMKLQGQRP